MELHEYKVSTLKDVETILSKGSIERAVMIAIDALRLLRTECNGVAKQALKDMGVE